MLNNATPLDAPLDQATMTSQQREAVVELYLHHFGQQHLAPLCPHEERLARAVAWFNRMILALTPTPDSATARMAIVIQVNAEHVAAFPFRDTHARKHGTHHAKRNLNRKRRSR